MVRNNKLKQHTDAVSALELPRTKSCGRWASCRRPEKKVRIPELEGAYWVFPAHTSRSPSCPRPASLGPSDFATALVKGAVMQPYSSGDSLTRCEAFNLAAALDAYELTCSRLVSQWMHMELYAQAGAAIAAIREHGVSVPSLTVLTLQLAIAHCELESTLWQKKSVGVSAEQLDEALARHADAAQCLRIAARKILTIEQA
jgi:hypothetical protein